MVDAESHAARSHHGRMRGNSWAHPLKNEAPLYRVQRLAREEAAGQALVNLLRRLIGLPVRRTSGDAEFEVLDAHRVPRNCATWTGKTGQV